MPERSATFVVDGGPPFCYTVWQKGGFVMENWALPEINLDLCNRCGDCVTKCPTNSVEMGPQGPFFARSRDCTYCAVCETVCPQGAITCTYEIVWKTEG